MGDALVEQLRALAEPILAERAIELVELSCHPQGRQQIIRFLVDTVGGVTIQQCAKANQRIGEALEAANLIDGSYTIEVSSPGLDRPLVSKHDFERALGEDLQVNRTPIEGRVRELRGQLLAVQQEAIVLKLMSGNVTVPFGEIELARKAIRW